MKGYAKALHNIGFFYIVLLPGDIIGNCYRVKSILAEGGMAELYLVESLIGSQGKLFVAKCPLSQSRINPELCELFEKEIGVMKLLSHPNIVRVIEVVNDFKNNKKFLILEYITGKNLREILVNYKKKDVKFRVNLALSVAQKILPVLGYLHNLKNKYGQKLHIVHKDLSLSNIIISHDGEVKIIDFGAAKIKDNVNNCLKKRVFGKLCFMSPEQVSGGQISNKSDLFSLSLIILEIIMGRSIFAGMSDNYIQKCLLSAQELKVPKFDKKWQGLRDIITRGLRKDPEKRFACAQEYLLVINKIIIAHKILNPELILQSSITGYTQKPLGTRWNLADLFYAGIFASLVCLVILGILSPIGRKMSTEIFSPIIDPKLRPLLNEIPLEKSPNKIKNKVEKNFFGKLMIVARPWAEVYIEGKFVGATPMSAINLKEGNYIIELKNPQLEKTALRMVRIKARGNTQIFHDFGST